MRRSGVVAFLGFALGSALGAAIAASPSAVATTDPVSDAWPYGTPPFGQLPGDATNLPGFIVPASGTNSGQTGFGPFFTDTYSDYTVSHTDGGPADWYSAHSNTFVIPNFYEDDQETVKTLLDSSAAYPSVGTVMDHSSFFPIYNPAFGTINLIQNYSLNDPNLGFADQYALFPAMMNTYVSDHAGVEDIVSGFGHSYTVFDIPFTASSTAASDGFAQLLGELGTAFPDASTLGDLSALF